MKYLLLSLCWLMLSCTTTSKDLTIVAAPFLTKDIVAFTQDYLQEKNVLTIHTDSPDQAWKLFLSSDEVDLLVVTTKQHNLAPDEVKGLGYTSGFSIIQVDDYVWVAWKESMYVDHPGVLELIEEKWLYPWRRKLDPPTIGPVRPAK